MPEHRVEVEGLPDWLDPTDVLGPGAWEQASGGEGSARCVRATLSREDAADLAARLRGLGFDGAAIAVHVEPALPRAAVRAARTADARRRRESSPGFTRKGVRLDEEGRVSLTPEALAQAMAESLVETLGRPATQCRVLDAGCGVGGNAIAFARAGARVIAVERNAERLAMARHNAKVYGVEGQIEFVHGDATEEAKRRDLDLLFVDPPWGVEWNRVRVDPDSLSPLPELLAARPPGTVLWAKVPPSTDTRALQGVRVRPMFGVAKGDRRRVKFLWLSFSP